ncbi:hypothetical protein [Catellatospora chokoriensis]|uniref:Uncharacterized protein n=1 Tax=Catellatospora chokoriensis TaxID=310353 RepID=A0A8J3KAN9_9ACTN|nr:hypothetical protein [Catellatospora chokoriensis]GIF93765.1 hypothetical protein Cch02nite_72090 [Catellatospora chokoriensis]
METLKMFSRTGLVGVVGLALLLIGISEEFSVGIASVRIPENGPWRLVLGATGVALVFIALVRLAITAYRRSVSPPPEFLALIDSPQHAFGHVAKDVTRLSILARTAVNLVTGYSDVLRRLIHEGCEIRILLVDPACAAARHLYADNYARFHRNLFQTATFLRELNDTVNADGSGRAVTIRLIKHDPPFSLLYVEKADDTRSLLDVQLTLTRTLVGRGRPVFRLARVNPWYDAFREEFDVTWSQHAEPVTPAELLARLNETI